MVTEPEIPDSVASPTIVQIELTPKKLYFGVAGGVLAYFAWKEFYAPRSKDEFYLKRIYQLLNPHYDAYQRRYIDPDQVDWSQTDVPTVLASPAETERRADDEEEADDN